VNFAEWYEQIYAQRLRDLGPLESWRMASWDERDSYFELGSVLSADDVPIYRPAYPFPGLPGVDVAVEERAIRTWVRVVAPRYRLERVQIAALRPAARDNLHERVWVEKFIDLIRRGAEPPPIVCDVVTGSIINGSVRVHALRELGRENVHAWVAHHRGRV
jgi:hypothetical protein